MTKEYESILKNDVWDIVPRPEGKSIVTSKWIFKVKHATNKSIEKYKERFVAHGYSQREEVDYDDTFALVSWFTSICTIIALASTMGWKLFQMDVKTTFINGEIEEEVYVENLEGFKVHGKETHVCRLKKALYGLKQAPRAWYGQIDGFLPRLEFTKSDVDSNLYYKVVKGDTFIMALYVDCLFLIGEDRLVTWCTKQLSLEFEMKDLGLIQLFLGLEILQQSNVILVSRGKYTVDILRIFGMMHCKSMATPMNLNLKKLYSDELDLVDPTMYRQLIGSLMYLSTLDWIYTLS